MIRYILFVVLFAFGSIFLSGCLKDEKPYPQEPTIVDSLNSEAAAIDKFAIVGNDLCIVSGSTIKIYDIQNPSAPAHLHDQGMGGQILSLRTLGDSLLVVGTQSAGLTVFGVTISGQLQQSYSPSAGQYYDPVAFQGNYLFDLRQGSTYNYNSYPDWLDVYDLKSPLSPAVFSSQKSLTYPKDLAIDNNNLFVCDSGLKVFDATNDTDIVMKKHFDIDANKISVNNGNLFILGATGLYQYRYASDTIGLLSKINIAQTP